MKQKRSIIPGLLLTALLCLASGSVEIINVLIIGDSISIGYTPFVADALAPAVTVIHNPGNGGSTVRGRDSIESWIGNREWDVILFNFGLHDLVYKDSLNKYDVIRGKQAVSPDDYRKNLEYIVSGLKESTARIIFMTTTMVPENSSGRKPEDPARYNAVAVEVMERNGIGVLDLYTPSLTIHPACSKPGNVHYTPEGYKKLAQLVTDAIRKSL